MTTFKTYLIYALLGDRLIGLAVLCVHQNRELDKDEIVNRFSNKSMSKKNQNPNHTIIFY